MPLWIALTVMLWAAPAAAQSFDGSWSVDVDVTRGTCPEGRSFPIEVRGGQIRYAGNLDLDASGQVGRDGRVTATFRRAAESLSATGRVTGQSGSGSWRAPTRDCSGTWRARKLG